MKLLTKVAVGTSLALAMSFSAFAGPINGSEALSGIGNTDKLNIGDTFGVSATVVTAKYFSMASLLNSGGVGDFTTDATVIFAGPFILDASGGVGANSFTISNTGWGTFTASSLVYDTPGSNARNFGLLGTFTPGTNQLAGTTINTASLVIGFTQSGGPGSAISASLTLNTPAANLTGAPEPATLSLIGGALIGLGFIRRRRAA